MNYDSVPTYGMPSVAVGRSVWLETTPGSEQPILKTSLAGSSDETVLIDVNKLSADASLSIWSYSLSPDGRMLVYTVRKKGLQEFTLHEKSLQNDAVNQVIPGPSSLSGSSGIGWVNGSSGFYYTKELLDSDPPNSGTPPVTYQAIYYHGVGTDPTKDTHVFGGKAYPGWRFSSQTFEDGKYLIVRFWKKTGLTRGVLLIPLQAGVAQPDDAILVDEQLTSWSKPLGIHNGQLIMLTNNQAEKYRIVAVDLKHPERESWKAIVPAGDLVIEDAIQIGSKIGVAYLADASSEMSIFGLDGALLKSIALPGVGSLSSISADRAGSKLLFGYESISQPRTIYSLDLSSFAYDVLFSSKTHFQTANYIVKREFVTARDKTRIPVFVAHRKGMVMNGKNPFLLFGYGGFGVSLGSGFSPRDAAWLEMGGGLVVSGGRGGGEYGESWHQDGMLLKKQNAINDFLDVAEWMIRQHYTDKKHLAINGISHGGMLVSSAVNQRPDLFGAVVNTFGLTDMIRNEAANTGFDWTDEFGSVKDEASFRNLLSYSPLHNIKQNTEYPPILVVAAELDDRVVPWHQYKYIAALQNSNLGHASKLLYVSYGTGHVFGKSKSSLLNERSVTLSFIANALGMPMQ